MYPWRNETGGERPKILSARNLALAALLHLGVFAFSFAVALVQNIFAPKETVIPIELEVVVNENLDGKENEPPPLAKNDPPPPPPPVKKTPKAEPEKPPENLDAVVKVKEPEKKPPKKKAEPPKKEVKKKAEPPEKKPPPPKKSKKELLKERLERMRNQAKDTKRKVKIEVKNAPSGDGRTERQRMSQAEILKHLSSGARPGSKTRLAANETQRCVSLIKMALQRKWDELSPAIDREGVVVLSVRVTQAGRLVDCRLVRGSGGTLSDKAVLSVAGSVGIVHGLSPEFIAGCRNESVLINYTVSSR